MGIDDGVRGQPAYSGMVLAKGMFRLIGTCAGALVSIGMVALYGQASLPFLLLMALWLAFCTAGASLLHNHASYGFVLPATPRPSSPCRPAPIGDGVRPGGGPAVSRSAWASSARRW